MNTREKIRDKALEMFNERGIEYVGLRELADLLGIRVSNITYYFPTKDDLVFDISVELSKANSEVIKTTETLTITGFLEMLQQVFQNHQRYRCLFLSFVHLMQQNKRIADSYKQTQANRSQTMRANLEKLTANGYLSVTREKELDFLVSTVSLVSRFWISEAAISFRGMNMDASMHYALEMMARLLLPHATAKGKREIKMFLERLGQ